MSYLKQQQKIEVAVCIMNCVFRLGCSNQKENNKISSVCINQCLKRGISVSEMRILKCVFNFSVRKDIEIGLYTKSKI